MCPPTQEDSTSKEEEAEVEAVLEEAEEVLESVHSEEEAIEGET